MKHWTLIVFTIFVQAAIGIMVFAGISYVLQKDLLNEEVIILSGGLAVAGIVVSMLHMGRPLRAIGTFVNWKTSWLSREIFFTSIFTIVTVITALLIVFNVANYALTTLLILVAGITGLLAVCAMAFCYITSSVPAWQHPAIAIEFYSATLSMGGVLFVILGGGQSTTHQHVYAFIVSLAVALQAVAMVRYYLDLGANNAAAKQQSIKVLRKKSLVLTGKWLFLLGGAYMFVDGGLMEIAVLLVILGQIMGRYLFYEVEAEPRIGLC